MTPPSTAAPYPLVSVLMPTYNCAPYLREALDSILGQDYPNLEVIVVDDGSSDGSADIAESYGPPVRVLRQQNQGPAAARNRAAQAATGEYLAFLDGDDLWLPGKLKAQVEHFHAHPEAGIVYACFQRWRMGDSGSYPPKDSVPVSLSSSGIVAADSGWIYHKLLLDSRIHIITAMIPRTLFNTLGGFDESLRIGEDYDFWLRASRLTQAHKLTRDVALYRVNPASTTHVVRSTNIGEGMLLRAIKKYGLASPNGESISRQQMNERLFEIAFDHGYMHYWHGSPCVAWRAFRDAIAYSPLHIKAHGYRLLSYLRCKRAGPNGSAQ